MRLTAEMEAETQAHVALGLTPDQKPVFDLLVREDLTKEEIRQLKSTSVEILKAMMRKVEEIQDLFQKQSTRDGVRQEIYDLLYNEDTGLPASKYDDDALDTKTDLLFQFFESRYSEGDRPSV